MKLNYFFAERKLADEFKIWLQSRGVTSKIAPALPRFRHGASPGTSVLWRQENIVAANEEAQEARKRGAQKWTRP